MSSKAIQAVLFDLGQTLLCFGGLVSGRLFSQAVGRTYTYLKEMSQPAPGFFRYRLTHLLGLRWHLLVSAITGNDFDSLRLLKNYGQRHGFNLTEAQWQELNWRWYEPMAELAYIEPGLAGTLRKLAAMDLKLGIVSNTFVNGSSLDRHLEQLGLLEFFPVRLYSCHFSWRKPDRRIFIRAAEQLGIEPGRILFVGDKLDTDVRGALRAGMMPVFKCISANRGKKIPVGVLAIDKISDLPALVGRIEGGQK